MANLGRLKNMSDEDIQDWLRGVGVEGAVGLGLAMLEADEDTKKCVFRNMSERAVSVLKGDMKRYEAMGPDELNMMKKANKIK